ncbi:MAG: hypothetical protein ABI675_21110 [Chitinophagaceae bacterium]
MTRIYTECSNGYHKIDDFRAKLLGFLPLASATGIFGTLYIDSKTVMSGNHIALGLFGALSTIGLLVYELKGILKCTQFIFLGRWIEAILNKDIYVAVNEKEISKKIPGFFTELLEDVFMTRVVVEPVASAFVYSTVLASWVYIIFLKSCVYKWVIPAMVFLAVFSGIYVYWKIIFKKIKRAYDTKTQGISSVG